MGCGASAGGGGKQQKAEDDTIWQDVLEKCLVNPLMELGSIQVRKKLVRANTAHLLSHGRSRYAADDVLKAMCPKDLKALYQRIQDHPQVSHLDSYCLAVMYNFWNLAGTYSDDPRMRNVSTFLADRRTLDKHSVEISGKTVFQVPEAEQDEDFAESGFSKVILADLKEDAVKYFTSRVMDVYDERDPKFFESIEEAAIYFRILMRSNLPGPNVMGPYYEALHLKGDLSAICFSGFAAWYLQAIDGDQWDCREAGDSCTPPAGAKFVVDVSALAEQKVRKGYERLGAACFFDAQRRPLAIWLDDSREMVPAVGQGGAGDKAAAAEWAFAAFKFRSSVLFGSFGINHLVWCHWIVSNSLVTSAREHLRADHALRRFIKPFTFGSISINRSTVVRLTGVGGAAERASAWPADALDEAIARCSRTFKYQTFEAFCRNKNLPDELLKELPLAKDGIRLWNVFHSFVSAFLLAAFPPPSKSAAPGSPLAARMEEACAAEADPVARDPEIRAFWAGVNRARPHMVLGLPMLSRAALADYLTHAMFYSTAVHELMGNVIHYMTVPSIMSFRVHKRERFGQTRLPQATIIEFLQNIAICGSVQLKMPQLVCSMRKIGETWNGPEWGPRPDVAKTYEDFIRNLDDLADKIDTDNLSRENRFDLFNPRGLEVSVSL